MLGIRQKLSIGFSGLLVIIVVICAQSINLFSQLGNSIDVILRENYRSVVACQQMKEALERIDSGILFVLLGYSQEGIQLIKLNQLNFEKALEVELNNITLPGEGEKAAHLANLFEQYKSKTEIIKNENISSAAKTDLYFSKMLGLFQQMKTEAENILQINQQHMTNANDQARRRATAAKKQMYLFLMMGSALSLIYIVLIGRWILRPIMRLRTSANEIAAGNLDLVVNAESSDEIGQLSKSFNSMAESLRRVRRTREARIAHIQKTIEEAFKVLPEAIAIINLQGQVEIATKCAAEYFDLIPYKNINDLPFIWLKKLFGATINNLQYGQQNSTILVQHFINGQEHYFQPRAVPIRNGEKETTAALIIIADVTRQREQTELKRNVISTVSHQLKTPLTSVRMAIHLLLDEDIGSLNEKQLDVLVGAEEEAGRLHTILQNLLDIGRIGAGKAYLDMHRLKSNTFLLDSIEPFRTSCQDAGIQLSVNLQEDLPDIWVDPTRIPHVIANLLSNAIKYTNPGGVITVSASADDEFVKFAISDTGKGIPEGYLTTIFEQFFRVPGETSQFGVGLGLAIAKEIVEAHGGKISAESHEHQGSTFTFSVQRFNADSMEK